MEENVRVVPWQTVDVIEVEGARKLSARCPHCEHLALYPAEPDEGETVLTPPMTCENCRRQFRVEIPHGAPGVAD